MFKIVDRPDNILEINPIRDNGNLTHIKWIERDRTSKKRVFYRKYEVSQKYDLSYIKIEEDKDSIIKYDYLMFIIENEQDLNIAIKHRDYIQYGEQKRDLDKYSHSRSDTLEGHIFLCEVDYNLWINAQDLAWEKNIFTKKVENCGYNKNNKINNNIVFLTSIQNLCFRDNIFLKEFYIQQAIIKGEIFIFHNIFQKDFASEAVCLSGEMEISDCICYKNFIIHIDTDLVSQEYKNNSGFQECNFSSLTVYGSLYIYNLSSKYIILLFNTKVYNKLKTLDITTKILDISDSEIDYIDFGTSRNQIEQVYYQKSTIKSANSYHDFTLLKNMAIDNRDNIQALEYHRQEMHTHLQEVRIKFLKFNRQCFKAFFDFIILGFECISSSYGTSYIRVIGWLCVLHFISGLFLYDVGWTVGNFSDIIFTSLKNYNPFNDKEIKGTFGWIVILKHILNYILIYELIKSFRKYSRKL